MSIIKTGLARTYIVAVSLFYILFGISAIIPSVGGQHLMGKLYFLGLKLGIIPVLVNIVGKLPDFIDPLIFLGLMATVGSLTVIALLAFLGKKPELIKFLRIFGWISYFITATNILFSIFGYPREIPIIFQFIHPTLTYLSINALAKKYLQPKRKFPKIILAILLVVAVLLGLILFIADAKFSWRSGEDLRCLRNKAAGQGCYGFSSCDYKGIQIPSLNIEIVFRASCI